MVSAMPGEGPTDPIFESVVSAEIAVACQAIDLSEWLFGLTSEEYEACCRDHIACGRSRAPDGRRMSINVEQIGGDLLIQHYVEEVATPARCVVRSMSDLFHRLGQATMEIVWEVTVEPADQDRTRFTNRILAGATPELRALLEAHGIDVVDAAPAMKALADVHNAEETPNFARNIEDRVLGWPTSRVSQPPLDLEAEILVESQFRIPVDAPVSSLDLGTWLFGLSDQDYQACSVAHLAAGVSRTADADFPSMSRNRRRCWSRNIRRIDRRPITAVWFPRAPSC